MAAPNSTQTELLINAGLGVDHIYIPVNLATLTDAAQFTVNPGHKGRLLSVDFYVHIPATTAAKLSTLTPSIAGVNVTGGVLALTSANCTPRNAKVTGSTVTGNNAFTATQTIIITGSATTAFVEGTGMIDVKLVNDDLVNALARSMGGLRVPNPD